ncbi:MAG TPA: type II secretion system F family protein [Geobacteraceae bacterium]|nr:type II secretion system F family protein [Geobacteraceae bacterium]
MTIYNCKLGSSDDRIVEKEFEAANPETLRQSLEEQGFFVFEVKKKAFQFLWEKGIARRKVDTRELLTFNQELLVLLKAGLPIVQSLDTILEKGGKGKLTEILQEVREDIKGGASLSDALEKHSRVFSHLYIATIRAGERTGDLPQTIRRYLTFLKRIEGFRKKVISAFIYPAILVTVAFFAVTLLLVYVVPTFSKIYADAGSQLPLPTQILIAFTTMLQRYILLVVGIIITAMALFRRWGMTDQGRFLIDGWKLRIPFVGNLLNNYAVAGFSRTFATILGSGIPIVEALKMSVGTLNNKVLERKLLEAIISVEEGTMLSTALERVNIMPPLALRMLGVGETTGALEEMLGEISDYFEEEIDRKLNILTTSIEPAVMIVMGVIIGVIIITMYLPVFRIAGTVG